MSEEKMKGPIAWMAGNHVASNLLMLILLIGGIFMGFKIKKEVFPEMSMDYVIVTVPYQGASPEEIEKGIILAIEENVRSIEGIKDVNGTAREGSGEVKIQVETGENIDRIKQEVQQEIDRITSFPDDAEDAQLTTMVSKKQVISFVLYGDFDKKTLRYYAEKVREDILDDGKISQIELISADPLEITIEISQENLRRYNLTIGEVAEKLKRSSVEIPGGSVKTEKGEIVFRIKERKEFGFEFAKTAIMSLPDGSELLLEDIATITDGFEEVDYFTTYDGKPAMMLNVFRVGDQGPIEVADIIKEYQAEYNKTLPKGLHLATTGDMSEIYKDRIDLLLRNGYIGLALVFVMLALFLEIRLAFWVSMGIPISFLGCMLFLPAMDASINMISLFAFIIALGIVVDDAIVVGENIYGKHKTGMPFSKAAAVAAQEVSHPVIFSILTNIVAFLPLYFVPGFLGKIFKFIPIVVIIVFTISLFESLFILPAHIGGQKDLNWKRIWFPFNYLYKFQQLFSVWFMKTVEQIYGPIVRFTLRFRYITVSVALAVLIITVGYIKSGRMGLAMFPKIEADRAVAIAKLPFGVDVKKSKLVEKELLKAIQEIEAETNEQLTRGVLSIVGGSGADPMKLESSYAGGGASHIIRIDVRLTPEKDRTIMASKLCNMWREKTKHLIGLDSLLFQADAGGPGGEVALSIGISHKSLDTLKLASADIAEELTNYSTVTDISDGFPDGKEQLDFKILPEGKKLGLTAASIAKQVRDSFYGAEVAKHQRGRNEVKTMVRLPKKERISEYNIENMLVKTPNGVFVMLNEVTKIIRGRSYTVINRTDSKRMIKVTADVTPRSSAGQVLKDLSEKFYPKLLEKYPDLKFTTEGKQKDMAENMSSLMTTFPIAMLIIYALLAIPFRSYIQPAIIMVSIPFGIVGAVIGHLIMGYSLSMLSMFGVVALSGVVVNDSLVLIEFANRMRNKGMCPFDAVATAGIRRFRPIMLTTISTFGGLAPMILETSMQAKFLIPMAISLGFGIVGATLIALLLVPSLYMILEDFYKLVGKKHEVVEF